VRQDLNPVTWWKIALIVVIVAYLAFALWHGTL